MRWALAASLIFISSWATANPEVTPIRALLEESQTIVIAKVRAAPAAATSDTLEVERVLRGKAQRGTLVVKRSPGGAVRLAAGTRVVAFIDANQAWFAFGTASHGRTLEAGLVALSGFSAPGTHHVFPDLVTLGELRRLISNGLPLRLVYRGPVLVASPKGIVPTTFEVSASMATGNVNGIPNLVGFGAPTIWPRIGGVVEVRRSNGLPNRPLALVGEVVGKHADGTIAVRFRLEAPEVMTESDLLAYLASDQRRRPYYELVLDLGARQLPVILGRASASTIGADPIRHATDDELATDHALVTLAAAPAPEALVARAIMGPVACTYTRAGGKATPCTLRYLATKFERP